MSLQNIIAQMPVFILCGGLGTRLKEETEFRPKPMVPVGGRPIVWHIMRTYYRYGFRRFVLCTGFKSEVIKSYFLHYASMHSDFAVDLKTNSLTCHSIDHEEDWEVTIAHTGDNTMTGGRVARAAARYLGDVEHAAVTYGDGLTDANLAKELEFHLGRGKKGTVLGVNPPSRFGEIRLEGEEVVAFAEKPRFDEKWINGGYFFFHRSFFSDYLWSGEECVLEQKPLIRLAEDREMSLFKHRGFWACMDTQRDRQHLEKLWASGEPPWANPLPVAGYVSEERKSEVLI